MTTGHDVRPTWGGRRLPSTSHAQVSSVSRRLVPTVLGVYLVARLVSTLIITWLATHQDPGGIPGGPASGGAVSYWDVTRMWDGEWYRKIATGGYPQVVPRDAQGSVLQSELAFYPLYPILVRLGMGLTGGSFAVAGSLLSLVLGGVAVVLMAKLLAPRVGALAAICGVAVLASAPPSPTLQMAYTESLAMVLLCGLLLALERRRWSMAAALALTLGLARPVAAPLALVALVVVLQRWRGRREAGVERREWISMGALVLACAASGALWPLLTWFMTGERNAYTATMGAWRASHEVVPFQPWWGVATYLFGSPWGVLAVIALVITMTALIAGPWAARLGAVLTTWCAAYGLYLFATLDPWSSTYRYLLLFFPLTTVIIGGAWRRGPSRFMVPLTVAVVVLNLAGQLYWCTHYLHLVPPVGNPP